MAEQVGNYLEQGNSARPWISRPAWGVVVLPGTLVGSPDDIAGEETLIGLLKAIALGDFGPPGPPAGKRLLEDGDDRLLEDGDERLLEG